ncbi:MAG: DUF2268 domain-containing putative Zn-dependent protease [Minisyncoccia bacterium]
MQSEKVDVIQYDRSFSKENFPFLQELVGYTLSSVRNFLKFEKPVIIKVSIDKGQSPKYISAGETSKKSISLHLSKKYLYSKDIEKGLPSTLIHEYVHFMRLNMGVHRNRTIFQCMVEEGIAIYIQIKLSTHKPNYLDLKNLDKKMLETCWKKLNQVLDHSSKSKVFKKIMSDNTYRAIYYRLGFGVVRGFARMNNKLSTADLAMTPNDKLILSVKRQFNLLGS